MVSAHGGDADADRGPPPDKVGKHDTSCDAIHGGRRQMSQERCELCGKSISLPRRGSQSLLMKVIAAPHWAHAFKVNRISAKRAFAEDSKKPPALLCLKSHY